MAFHAAAKHGILKCLDVTIIDGILDFAYSPFVDLDFLSLRQLPGQISALCGWQEYEKAFKESLLARHCDNTNP